MTEVQTSSQLATFKFQLKNVASKKIEGCLGPTYGWEFDGLGDRGAIEVIVDHTRLDFKLQPGEVYVWEQSIYFDNGAPAGERVHFYFDIYRRKCKGKILYRVRSEPTSTKLEDLPASGGDAK